MKKKVWILPQTVHGLTLLGMRSAHCNNAGQFGFPGGNVDAGELPLDAAVREFFEECGVRIIADDLVLAVVDATTDKDSINYYYMLPHNRWDAKDLQLTVEVDSYLLVDFKGPSMRTHLKLHKRVLQYLDSFQLWT